MSDDWNHYTPSTDAVREIYAAQYSLREDREEGVEEFNRWLKTYTAHIWNQARYFSGHLTKNPYEE